MIYEDGSLKEKVKCSGCGTETDDVVMCGHCRRWHCRKCQAEFMLSQVSGEHVQVCRKCALSRPDHIISWGNGKNDFRDHFIIMRCPGGDDWAFKVGVVAVHMARYRMAEHGLLFDFAMGTVEVSLADQAQQTAMDWFRGRMSWSDVSKWAVKLPKVEAVDMEQAKQSSVCVVARAGDAELRGWK